MLNKKFKSLLLVAGLIFGFSLGTGAYVNQFRKMLEVPGCVVSINNSLQRRVPDEIKLSNKKVRDFCEEFDEYEKKITSNQNLLTPSQKSKKIEKLMADFLNLCTNDADFYAAFLEAICGKSHASIQNGVGNSKIRRVPGSHSGL